MILIDNNNTLLHCYNNNNYYWDKYSFEMKFFLNFGIKSIHFNTLCVDYLPSNLCLFTAPALVLAKLCNYNFTD